MTRFHIGVIITGALLCFAPATMAFNSWAIFLVPVSSALGVSTGIFSLQPSILYLAAALFAPIGGRLIERFDLKVVLTVSSIAVGLSLLISSRCDSLLLFFLMGIIQGCAGVVLITLMLPNLISRWFYQKMGTVIGVCIALSGAGGALWAYVGGCVIVAADWRAAYLVLGAICLIVSVPPCLTLLKNRPSDVGVAPYGESDGEASADSVDLKGVPAKVAFGSSVFILFAVGIGLLDGIIGMANLLPTYVYYLADAGYFAMSASEVVIAASTIALCTQASQACCKILLGFLSDRNANASFVIGVGAGIVAVFCFLLGKSIPAIVFAGGVLFGALFAILDVISPVLARVFFGDRDYARIYARFAMIVNIVPAFAIFLFASLSEFSWTVTFIVGGLCLVGTMACGLFAISRSKVLRARFDSK